MTRKTSRFSRLKVGIAAVAIGALLVVPSASADTDTATVEVTGEDLTESIGPAAFASTPFGTSDRDVLGDTAISVQDDRGTTGDWHTTLEATDLDDGDVETTETIPASGMIYLNESDVTGDDDGTVTHRDNVSGLEVEGGGVIADGAGAHGATGWTGNLSLTVPGSTLAGTYTGTLTFTAVEGPEPA